MVAVLNSFISFPGGASVTFVNGRAQTAGTSINLSGDGAQVGDIIIVSIPLKSGTPSLSGSGWTQADFSWYGGAYTGTYLWKVLDNTTTITVSGDPFYGHHYSIWRGATSAALVVTQDHTAVSSNFDVTWPTPNAGCKVQSIMYQQQSALNPTQPSGFTERYSTRIVGVFTMEEMDRDAVSSGATNISNAQSAGPACALGFELRN